MKIEWSIEIGRSFEDISNYQFHNKVCQGKATQNSFQKIHKKLNSLFKSKFPENDDYYKTKTTSNNLIPIASIWNDNIQITNNESKIPLITNNLTINSGKLASPLRDRPSSKIVQR